MRGLPRLQCNIANYISVADDCDAAVDGELDFQLSSRPGLCSVGDIVHLVDGMKE